MRKNTKEIVVNEETSIKKSNEISLAKLNKGLTLHQMQLLAYAIFCTQKDGSIIFHKSAFEKKFEMDEYKREAAKKDTLKLMQLVFTLDKPSEVDDFFEHISVFDRFTYHRGTFKIEWGRSFLPHILDLRERYIVNDLNITSKFRSSFSWVLYEHLKALHGFWHKQYSKEELLRIFNVEHVKSYVKNTASFKQKILDVAIEEINEHTEMMVHYVDKKKGRSVVGFDIHWSTGTTQLEATTKQLEELTSYITSIELSMFDYMDLQREDYRKEAIETIREIIAMKKYTEGNSIIDRGKAKELILKVKQNSARLEQIKEQDKRPVPVMYNWLEERE